MLEVGGHELQCVIGGGVELGTQRFFSLFFFILIVGIKHHDSLFIAYLEHSLTKSDKDGVFPHLCLPVI